MTNEFSFYRKKPTYPLLSKVKWSNPNIMSKRKMVILFSNCLLVLSIQVIHVLACVNCQLPF